MKFDYFFHPPCGPSTSNHIWPCCPLTMQPDQMQSEAVGAMESGQEEETPPASSNVARFHSQVAGRVPSISLPSGIMIGTWQVPVILLEPQGQSQEDPIWGLEPSGSVLIPTWFHFPYWLLILLQWNSNFNSVESILIKDIPYFPDYKSRFFT